MALIVEDGSGVENANSYMSVADINTYLISLGYLSTADVVEADVLRAMVYIESFKYKGSKAYDYDINELCFPRDDLYDKNSILLASDEVPTKIKNALAMASFYERQTNFTLMPSVTDPGAIKREKIDVLETEYFSGSTSGYTAYTVINNLLAEFISSSNFGTISRT